MTHSPRRNWIYKVALVADTDECVLWPYATTRGYGVAWKDGELQYAHVVACEEAHGPKPFDGAEVCHSCRTPRCCNKKHLRWGTSADNKEDCALHGTRVQGEAHYRHKLTSNDVVAIRASAARGVDLAEQYGVSQATISEARNRKLWRHVQ